MARMVEKRRERRIRVNLPIKIVYHEKIEIAARTENISRLGAYVEVDRAIPEAADLDITLTIPAYTKDSALTGSMRCKGNIFRSHVVVESEGKKTYGLGIFFTNFLEESDRNKLSRYIDFLIVQEERQIQKGLRRWRQKRDDTQQTKE